MSTHNVKLSTRQALNCFDGSVARLAEFLGISAEAVYQWGEYVPTLRVYQLREQFPNIGRSVPSAGTDSTAVESIPT